TQADPPAAAFSELLSPTVLDNEIFELPGRGEHTLFFDSLSDNSVLFGGESDDFCEDPEFGYCFMTWHWNGANWSAVDPELATPRPAARTQHSMAYAERSQQALLFGGEVQL